MPFWKNLGLNLTETFRRAAEYKKLKAGWPALRAATPEGDGHPVLVIPGFMAADDMTRPLLNALQEKGYKAYGWEAGMNLGLSHKTAKNISAHLRKIFEENGHRKVTLVGHSLGGLFARELAREFPEMVRGVITVASPFGAGLEKGAVHPLFQALIERLGGNNFILSDADMAERCMTPPPVPTTSVYSKTDGVAGWTGCLNPLADKTENIEVDASHLGIINCLETYTVILDRLFQPEGEWKPFVGASQEKQPANPQWKPGPKSKHNLFKKP